MKQYLLSVYHPEGGIPEPEAMEKIMADVDALNTELRQAGAWVFGGGLYPSSTATVVRVDGGDVLITDGPFVEGKEHVGGFWVIKAPDLDAALAWGRKATRACTVPIEVRPFQDEAPDVGPEVGTG
ncbi:MAG: YciI family protein [Streptosporangiaceae bacterium]